MKSVTLALGVVAVANSCLSAVSADVNYSYWTPVATVGCVSSWWVHDGFNYTSGACADADTRVGEAGWCATAVNESGHYIAGSDMYQNCDCNSRADCPSGHTCTDGVGADCILSGHADSYHDFCVPDTDAAAIDFARRCSTPVKKQRVGCAWPFTYENVTFNEGECATSEDGDWCGAEGWDEAADNMVYLMCDCDSDAECPDGYVCTDGGGGDCLLTGGEFSDSCMRADTVEVYDFRIACNPPNETVRTGCVWPFSYENVTFNHGECATSEDGDWCGAEGWDEAADNMAYLMCDCDSDAECPDGYVCTDGGGGDCLLTGGEFSDSCMRADTVEVYDFRIACNPPNETVRTGCVWPFAYNGTTFTAGYCAESNASGGYGGWCATDVDKEGNYIEDAYQFCDCNSNSDCQPDFVCTDGVGNDCTLDDDDGYDDTCVHKGSAAAQDFAYRCPIEVMPRTGCVWPFGYQGITYNEGECAGASDSSLGWCATAVNANGNMNNVDSGRDQQCDCDHNADCPTGYICYDGGFGDCALSGGDGGDDVCVHGRSDKALGFLARCGIDASGGTVVDCDNDSECPASSRCTDGGGNDCLLTGGGFNDVCVDKENDFARDFVRRCFTCDAATTSDECVGVEGSRCAWNSVGLTCGVAPEPQCSKIWTANAEGCERDQIGCPTSACENNADTTEDDWVEPWCRVDDDGWYNADEGAYGWKYCSPPEPECAAVWSSSEVGCTTDQTGCPTSACDSDVNTWCNTADSNWYNPATNAYGWKYCTPDTPVVVELADCKGKTPKECRKMKGPNGGENACRYNTLKRRCLNDESFEDNAVSESEPETETETEPAPEPEPESESEQEPTPTGTVDCKGKTPKQCRKTTGPNGGPNACRYNTLKKKCLNDESFEDNAVSEPEPETETEPESEQESTKVDCTVGNSQRRCSRIKGPNGGANACRFTKKMKCVNNKSFQDNATQQSVINCKGGNTRKQCNAIKGPNGESKVCKFNNSKRKCIINKAFSATGRRARHVAAVTNPNLLHP